MLGRMNRMAVEMRGRVGTRVRALAGFLGALDGALVDRGVKHTLAFLRPVLRVHRLADLLTLSCEWHRARLG